MNQFIHVYNQSITALDTLQQHANNLAQAASRYSELEDAQISEATNLDSTEIFSNKADCAGCLRRPASPGGYAMRFQIDTVQCRELLVQLTNGCAALEQAKKTPDMCGCSCILRPVIRKLMR